MTAVGVQQTVPEGWEVERSLVDVLGLLEDVLHGDGESIGADGAPSDKDVAPGPRCRTTVSGEVGEVKTR